MSGPGIIVNMASLTLNFSVGQIITQPPEAVEGGHVVGSVVLWPDLKFIDDSGRDSISFRIGNQGDFLKAGFIRYHCGDDQIFWA